jgi:hypothetical protein
MAELYERIKNFLGVTKSEDQHTEKDYAINEIEELHNRFKNSRSTTETEDNDTTETEDNDTTETEDNDIHIKKYWVSWYTTRGEDNDAPDVDFRHWLTSQGNRSDEDDPDTEEWTICATIEAINEEDVWDQVASAWPNYKYRFCNVKEDDFKPGDRFQ